MAELNSGEIWPQHDPAQTSGTVSQEGLPYSCIGNNQWDGGRRKQKLHQNYKLLLFKDTVKKIKREATTWEKIFAKYRSDQDLYLKYTRKPYKSKEDKQLIF